MAKKENTSGKWAYIIGLLVALVAAFVVTVSAQVWSIILVVLGLVVGWMNVSSKNATAYLVAALGFALAVGAGIQGQIDILGSQIVIIIQVILGNVVVLIAAAALVVAGKAVHELAGQ